VNTISNVQIIGQIAGTPERKTVTVKGEGKAVTEFRVAGIGLRIAAWERNAAQVPDAGLVIVNGYLSTRQYEYEGKTRESTDIRCTSIQVIDTAPAVDTDLPF
jgi:single-stranded DNA-binding protein